MCSIEQRLAEIGQALEELAIQARVPADSTEANGSVGSGQAGDGHVGEGAVAARAVGDSAAGNSAVSDSEGSTDTKDSAVAIESDDSGRILTRLAELWGLLAELDPEVARRVSGYQALLLVGWSAPRLLPSPARRSPQLARQAAKVRSRTRWAYARRCGGRPS